MRFILVWIVSTLFSAGTVAKNEPIMIGVSQQYASLTRLLACPFEKAALEYRVRYSPLIRVLYELKNGWLDAAFPFKQNKNRDQYAQLSIPMIKTQYFFVSRIGRTVDFEDTEQVYLHLRGFAGAEILDGAAGARVSISSWEQGLKLINRDRADFVLMTEGVFRELGWDHRENLVISTADTIDIGIYVSRRSPELLEKLNSGIEACPVVVYEG